MTMGSLVALHLLSGVFRGLLGQRRSLGVHVLYTAVEGWALYRDTREDEGPEQVEGMAVWRHRETR